MIRAKKIEDASMVLQCSQKVVSVGFLASSLTNRWLKIFGLKRSRVLRSDWERKRLVSMNPHLKIQFPNWKVPSHKASWKSIYLSWIDCLISVQFHHQCQFFHSLVILSSTCPSSPPRPRHRISRSSKKKDLF
jgi:hypothetical protein